MTGVKRWLIAIGLAAAATSALGGSVTEVNAKKRTVLVEMEDGEFAKGAEVCFFTAANKKIDCGKVTRVKGTQATVKLKSKSKMKRIKAGVAAKAATPVEGAEPAEGATTEEGAAAAPASDKPPFRIWGSYSPALATPTKFNKVSYAAPKTNETPSSLWSADAAVASALFGFNLQVGIPIGSNSLNVGLRLRTFTPSLTDADYNNGQLAPYTSAEQTASAMGLWFDFQFYRKAILSASSIWIASGLDIDQSSVQFTVTKKDDTGATPESELAKASSKLTVASVRVSTGLDLVFAKPLGAFLGVTVMVPVAEFSPTFSGSIGEGEARGVADPATDLKTSLGHKKNSVAYEVSLGSMLSF